MNCYPPGSSIPSRHHPLGSSRASHRSVHLAVEELEARHVPSTIGTPNQDFVDQVYQDLLHRSADPVGLAVLSNQLDSGALSRSQVVLAIQNSPEGRSTLVNDVFLRFLHRPADTLAMMAGSSFLAQGNSSVALEAQVIGSAE